MEKREYKSIDIFKFVFAILVVVIHAKPVQDISETANWFVSNSLLNLAVPFFFITSGFLLFDRLSQVEDRKQQFAVVKKYVLHVLRMYLVWTVIWLPMKVLGWYTSGGIDGGDVLQWLQDLFLTGKTGNGLWYLLALAICTVLACLITNYGKKRIPLLLGVATFLYVIGVLISSWYGVFQGNAVVDLYYTVFQTVENALLNGLVFFSLGAWVATHRQTISLKHSAILAAVGFVLLLLEVWLVYVMKMNRSGVCGLFTLPAVSILLFLALLQINISADSGICHRLRDYSTLIYVSHTLIIRVLLMLLGLVDVTLPYSVLFLCTLLCTMTFAVLVRYFSKTKEIKILKLLY